MRTRPRPTSLVWLSLLAGCDGLLIGAGDEASGGADLPEALARLPHAEILSMGSDGVPRFVRGQLGIVDPAQPSLELIAPVFGLDPRALRLERSLSDASGTHVRYQQTQAGLDVVGGDLTVHIDAGGSVYAVHGSARGAGDRDPEPSVSSEDALVAALLNGPASSSGDTPRLVFHLPDEGGELRLAWEVHVWGVTDDTPVDDLTYVDAKEGGILDLHPRVQTARNRRIYSAGNATSLPGTLRRSEGGASSSDAAVNDAYLNVGTTYDCYAAMFDRDSYDGAGAALIATVHFGRSFANAFWDGSQMVYGDGDGVDLGPLAGALDVTAHELTHAVTDRSAGLVYRNEPGALNEAMSDILGASCEAWKRGGVSANTWLLGEDVWTPGTPGDALRYMDDPTRDGWSTDYYPERYRGSEDYGGVHLNSGIANLAFKLLVTGGTHPRGKTSVPVPALGLERASAIFYRALTMYMTSTTTFSGARAATVQAAIDLYGDAVAQTVHKGWTAVGAPGAPPDDGVPPPPPPAGNRLDNGVPRTGLSGATGDELAYQVEVPAGGSRLVIQLSGGTGDADLYVRRDGPPTRTSYDYRPYLSGNNETVTISSPASGTWYVMVRAYSGYTGARLVATY